MPFLRGTKFRVPEDSFAAIQYMLESCDSGERIIITTECDYMIVEFFGKDCVMVLDPFGEKDQKMFDGIVVVS